MNLAVRRDRPGGTYRRTDKTSTKGGYVWVLWDGPGSLFPSLDRSLSSSAVDGRQPSPSFRLHDARPNKLRPDPVTWRRLLDLFVAGSTGEGDEGKVPELRETAVLVSRPGHLGSVELECQGPQSSPTLLSPPTSQSPLSTPSVHRDHPDLLHPLVPPSHQTLFY